MKNELTIYNPNGTFTEYRNIGHFQTLENGVSMFTVESDTVLMISSSPSVKKALPVGMTVKFKACFVYGDYSETADGEYEEPESDGGHW